MNIIKPLLWPQQYMNWLVVHACNPGGGRRLRHSLSSALHQVQGQPGLSRIFSQGKKKVMITSTLPNWGSIFSSMGISYVRGHVFSQSQLQWGFTSHLHPFFSIIKWAPLRNKHPLLPARVSVMSQTQLLSVISATPLTSRRSEGQGSTEHIPASARLVSASEEKESCKHFLDGLRSSFFKSIYFYFLLKQNKISLICKEANVEEKLKFGGVARQM